MYCAVSRDLIGVCRWCEKSRGVHSFPGCTAEPLSTSEIWRAIIGHQRALCFSSRIPFIRVRDCYDCLFPPSSFFLSLLSLLHMLLIPSRSTTTATKPPPSPEIPTFWVQEGMATFHDWITNPQLGQDVNGKSDRRTETIRSSQGEICQQVNSQHNTHGQRHKPNPRSFISRKSTSKQLRSTRWVREEIKEVIFLRDMVTRQCNDNSMSGVKQSKRNSILVYYRNLVHSVFISLARSTIEFWCIPFLFLQVGL